MPSSKVQDILDQLRDEGVEDSVVSDLEQAFENQPLRKQLGEQARRISELESVEEKFKALESVPHKKAALAKANVDYDKLPKAIRVLVDKELTDYEDEEKVSTFVSEYELPTSQGETTQSPSGAEAIQQHGQRQAPATAGAVEDREAELKKLFETGGAEAVVQYSKEHPADTPEWQT